MTTRIGHSPGAMRRLVQMMAARVVIYVEGRDLDRDFYGRLCGPICNQQGLPYEIIPADRIAGGGGGKAILIKHFRYLRKKGALTDRTVNPPKLVMFYVDKDTDDIFRKKCKSCHLVYTSLFCVENHLFSEGDLPASIATGGSIDPEVVRRRIPDPFEWRRNAAIRWRDWIALCLTAQKLGIGGKASYSVNHDTVDSNVNIANLAVCETNLQTRSGKPVAQFDQIVRWARRKVDEAIRLGEHDQVFKGKWYPVFAVYELRQIAITNGPINQNGAKDRLIGSLMATLGIQEPWAEHFTEPLRREIAAL